MQVDVAIITILEEEYDALAQRLHSQPQRFPSGRTYSVSHIQGQESQRLLVAIGRSWEQGPGVAQQLASAMIEDLDPLLLLVVGIAGGVPSPDFTLGDVIVSSRLHDFRLNAYKPGEIQWDQQGGIHPFISELVAKLPMYKSWLQDWNTPASLGVSRPMIEGKKFKDFDITQLTDEDKQRLFEGSPPDSWLKKILHGLQSNFGSSSRRDPSPRFSIGSVASSGSLIRDPSIVIQWLQNTRSIQAFEMEAAGVFQAAQHLQRQYPVMAIRGISDIPGLVRDDDWKHYACHSAAAFTKAFLQAGILEPEVDRATLSGNSSVGGTPPAREEIEQHLRRVIADHSSFLQNRLESFVGRQRELEALRRLIAERQQTGGYITITGQAGQGKSSIIAKLVKEYGPERTAFHFIPLTPGPDYQVGLLRSLMARLILTYHLSDQYIASENRAVLRDFFPKVLAEVAQRGGKEVIFLDGLDQLEGERFGERDLSFLPADVPAGIVLVLGTRPNDTLQPLRLLTDVREYALPQLGREDFDRILERHHVQLDSQVADLLYQAMQANALYLDLLAQELERQQASGGTLDLQQLTKGPDYPFALAINRLKHPSQEWREVIKPILGVLLVSQLPLDLPLIQQIVGSEDDQLRDGLLRLGGLIISDEQHRYSLYHRKFSDYLRQDAGHPEKDYLFALSEEQSWHARLARWCEGDSLEQIWQDNPFQPAEHERRLYAREHYLIHLYLAQRSEWPRLFTVLDEGSYGQHKIRVVDPSSRSYALDLDLGRWAAAWQGWTLAEAIAYLPFLWRYTFLRCSLHSRVDQYPLALFRLLLRLGRERHVVALAELVTKPSLQVSVFVELAHHFLAFPEREAEATFYFLRARAVANSLHEPSEKAGVLQDLAQALNPYNKELAEVIWQQAEEVVLSLRDDFLKAPALCRLALALTQAGRNEQADKIWQEAEKAARSTYFPGDFWNAHMLQELAGALAKAYYFERAEAVARSIPSSEEQAYALSLLAEELFKERREEQAEVIFSEVETMTRSLRKSTWHAQTLSALAGGLTQVQRWEQAETAARSIEPGLSQAWALRELAEALTGVQSAHDEAIWQAAEDAALSLPTIQQKAEALRELVEACCRVRRLAQAERVARTIADGYQQAWALSALALALITDQQPDRAHSLCAEAEKSIHHVSWDQAGARALRGLAEALTQAQRLDLVAVIWQKVELVTSSLEENHQKPQVLKELADALTKAHRFEQAERVARSIKDANQQAEAFSVLTKALCVDHHFEQAERVARSIQQRDHKAIALRVLAGSLVQAGLAERAEAIWHKAEVTIRTIEQRDQKAGLLRELAETLTQAGLAERAEVIWQEVDSEARMIEDPDRKAEILRVYVETLSRVRRFEQAEAVAHSIEQKSHQAGAWFLIAQALDRAKQQEQARVIWLRAQETARSIQDPYQKAETLRELAEALTEADHEEETGPIWQEAEEAAHAIEDSFRKTGMLCALARELTKAGRKSQAEPIWLEVRALTQSFGETFVGTGMLGELIHALAQAGEFEQAETVISSLKPSLLETMLLLPLVMTLAEAERWDHLARIEHVVGHSVLTLESRKGYVSTILREHGEEEAVRFIQGLWLQAETTEVALSLLALVHDLIMRHPDLGEGLYEAFSWVETFLNTMS